MRFPVVVAFTTVMRNWTREYFFGRSQILKSSVLILFYFIFIFPPNRPTALINCVVCGLKHMAYIEWLLRVSVHSFVVLAPWPTRFTQRVR